MKKNIIKLISKITGFSSVLATIAVGFIWVANKALIPAIGTTANLILAWIVLIVGFTGLIGWLLSLLD